MLSVVDLPQPEGPSSTTNSLSRISRLRSSNGDDIAGVALGDGLEDDACQCAPQPFTAPAVRPETM